MTNITKNIQAVAMIADSDDYRPALQSVYFTGQEAVATDGFILARTKSDIPEHKRDAVPYQKIRKGQQVDISGSIVDVSGVFEPKIIEVDYPSYQRVIPQEGQNNHLRIGFGVAVLEKLVKSMKKTGALHIELRFSAQKLKPIIGTCGDVEYTIMPYRLED